MKSVQLAGSVSGSSTFRLFDFSTLAFLPAHRDFHHRPLQPVAGAVSDTARGFQDRGAGRYTALCVFPEVSAFQPRAVGSGAFASWLELFMDGGLGWTAQPGARRRLAEPGFAKRKLSKLCGLHVDRTVQGRDRKIVEGRRKESNFSNVCRGGLLEMPPTTGQ